MSDDLCGACFKTNETEAVKIRHSRETGWVDSSVRRCVNPKCHNVREGTLADRWAHVRNVYDYKYFGDYELSPAQMDAVGEMMMFAEHAWKLAPALQKAADALHTAYVHDGTMHYLDACKEAEGLLRKLGYPAPEPF